jgi:hypothetical protein
MNGVQRLYSMFPTGRPGVALLLLRVALSVLLLHGVLAPLAKFGAPWILLVPWSIALALWMGCFTPVSAALCGLVQVSLWFTVPAAVEWIHVCTILDATALGLLGPGAYSLDARWFGRRRVILASGDGSSRP